FKSVDDLIKVKGIGPAVLAKLKDQASVGAPAPKGPAKPVLPAVKKIGEPVKEGASAAAGAFLFFVWKGNGWRKTCAISGNESMQRKCRLNMRSGSVLLGVSERNV
ncbi:hypothetical protein NYG72_001183, partial [Neisseria gonorrhoeae]